MPFPEWYLYKTKPIQISNLKSGNFFRHPWSTIATYSQSFVEVSFLDLKIAAQPTEIKIKDSLTSDSALNNVEYGNVLWSQMKYSYLEAKLDSRINNGAFYIVDILFSWPGSSMPWLLSLSHFHFWIWTQRVTFETLQTLDQSYILMKRQKHKNTNKN